MVVHSVLARICCRRHRSQSDGCDKHAKRDHVVRSSRPCWPPHSDQMARCYRSREQASQCNTTSRSLLKSRHVG
eukprot:15454795-Alexandrium_andersonii.AAC.1